MMLKTKILRTLCAFFCIILFIVMSLFDIIVEFCEKIIDFFDKLIDKIMNIC